MPARREYRPTWGRYRREERTMSEWHRMFIRAMISTTILVGLVTVAAGLNPWGFFYGGGS
jgi:hypothetical protein